MDPAPSSPCTRDPQRFVGKRATADSLSHFAAASEGVFTDVALDGADVTAAFSRGSVSGWVSAVAVQRSVLDAPLRRSMTALGIVGLLLVVSGGIAAFLISRRVSRDIVSAATAAEALADGRPVAPRRSSVSEVASLGDALVRSAALLEAHDRSRNDYVKQVEAARAGAESANRAKDEFLAMLGHELRNPLAPILTALHLMRMRGDDQQRRASATSSSGRSRHLARLVDDLLDVSRITRRQGRAAPRARRAAPRSSQRRRDRRAADRGARGTTLPTEVPGEPASGRRRPGPARPGARQPAHQRRASTPTPAAASALARAADDGDGGRSTCSDNGIGIAPELLPRHLRPVRRRASGRSIARSGGLGLGLRCRAALVELHGGTIERAQRRPRPRQRVHRPPAGAGERRRAPSAAGRRRGAAGRAPACRVLVVDDNRDARRHAGELLTRRRATTLASATTARRRCDARRRSARTSPLLDIGLPGHRRLRARPRAARHGPHVRLVAVTGYGQDGDVAAAHEAGFDLHLVKPAPMDRLIEFIQRRPRAHVERVRHKEHEASHLLCGDRLRG